MADWRRYYVPIFSEPSGRGLGKSRHVAGNYCYNSREELRHHCRHKGRLVAIVAIKGKTGKVQQSIYNKMW